MGASSTEGPQLTSKIAFLAVKLQRFDESGLVALAAWITHDLVTRIDELIEWVSASSDEELEFDDDVVAESGACCVVDGASS